MRKTNEPPATVLVRTELKWQGMEAAKELSGHSGREGMIATLVERFW
jgi:hypothetical protein